jgi:hypothetical protein
MDPRTQQNRRLFFGKQNEELLYGILAKNFQQRLGSSLNEKQSSRLERALEHYMSEVYEANAGVPVQSLNKEVLSVTASDFNDYIQRSDALVSANATPQMFQETSNRYEQLQQERQRTLEAPRPGVPDYLQAIVIKEDDSVSALSLFEDAKKKRNMEMNVQAETQMAKRQASAAQPLYLAAQDMNERPDPRSLYDRPLDMVVAGQQPQELPGRGDVNPTIARPGPPAARGVLPQDILIKQQDIQAYKETEYNLSVYSADRKWQMDNGENRFNFSVNLYSGNPTTGVSIMPKATARFRNIVRIEFVKAVLPIENTDMIVRKTTTSAYDTTYLKNVFGYPFVTLNVDELDTNNYGTSNNMDNAFAILQYDANWTDNTNSLGFTSMIPKHMKCQRIYSPTPLATLNKLTVRLQQPNGTLVSSTADTLDVNGAFLSITADVTTYNGSLPTTNYVDSVGEYIWIDSKTWFSKYQVSAGDRIQFKNLNALSATPTAAQTDFLTFLQRDDGHMVVAIATTAADGNNVAGYSKYIIIRSKFGDPNTGSTSVAPFGGAVSNAVLSTFLATNRFRTGRLINLSHQTQLIFRIVTREYDPGSLVRPDNL